MKRNDPHFYAGDFKAPDPKGGRSLSLEETSQFTRPTWATDKDTPIGQDEMGNTVFQGMGGRTYTTKPNPLYGQQRPEGGFIRAGIDALPPLEDWSLEGAGSAAARGAKVIADVLWDVIDTPRAALTGERVPTIGDAVDVAGFSATGGMAGFGVPEGALRANVPMFRKRSSVPSPLLPEAPINWKDYDLTPPSNEPGWANITRRDLQDYIDSSDLPDEWLEYRGMASDFWDDIPDGQVGNAQFLERATNSILRNKGRQASSEPFAEFRSPVKEIADEIEIPSKGLKGSQFLKELKDNPTVRNSEVAAMDLQIDPMKRYTREELSAIVDENLFTAQALGAGPRHRSMQRQPVLDSEVDYEEIMINASRQDGKPMFEPKYGDTHYDPNTIGHARVSVREGDTGRYLLVEEMQSDLVQKGYKPARRASEYTPWSEAARRQLDFYEESWGRDDLSAPLRQLASTDDPTKLLPNTFNQLESGLYNNQIDATEVRRFLKENNIVDPEAVIKNPFSDFTNATGVSVGRRFSRKVDEYFSESISSNLDETFTQDLVKFDRFLHLNYNVNMRNWLDLEPDQRPRFFEWAVQEVNKTPTNKEHAFLEQLLGIVQNRHYKTSAVAAPPVTSTTESTRAIVQSIMAYADQNNVGEIVFPPLERIAAQRFTPGTEGYSKAIKSGSGFHQTYVTSLNKVLKELEKELGPNFVQVRERPINYEPSASSQGGLQGLPDEDLASYIRWAQEEGISLREVMPEGLVRELDYQNGRGWEKNIKILPSSGISINIPVGQDIDLSRPRFNKGGLVVDYTKQALGELK